MGGRLGGKALPVPTVRRNDQGHGVGLVTCTEGKGYRHRIMLGTATMGLVRIEWHEAMTAIVMPTNWGWARCTPLGFHVDDAQNIIVQQTLQSGCEWLWLLEDDTAPPPMAAILMQEHIRKHDVPVVSGLYRQKGGSGEPLIYRGKSAGAFWDFKPGELVWADGVPTGCLLVHSSILQLMYDEAEAYTVQANGVKVGVKRVFQNPRRFDYDPASQRYEITTGTSDLDWCGRVREGNLLKRAGWPKVAGKEYPFLVDTRIDCKHIDRETGVAW